MARGSPWLKALARRARSQPRKRGVGLFDHSDCVKIRAGPAPLSRVVSPSLGEQRGTVFRLSPAGPLNSRTLPPRSRPDRRAAGMRACRCRPENERNGA